MNQQEQIRDLLKKVLAANGDTDPIADDELLVTTGRLSSLDVVDLLTSLETTFGLEINPSEFDPTKFDSINTITALLDQQRVPAKK